MTLQEFTARYARKFIFEHLCPWGPLFHKILTPDQTWACFCLGDGFGKMIPDQLAQINSGYDWSHVRDSSDQAATEIAAKIVELGHWALPIDRIAKKTYNQLNRQGLDPATLFQN